MRPPARLSRALRPLLLLLAAAACGGDAGADEDDDGADGDAPAAESPAAPRTSARAGHVAGTVRDERGAPISAPGARVTVGINGVAEQSAERVQYGPAVGADGRYDARVVAGTYHPLSAAVQVTWNRSTYAFDLDPVQDNTADRPSDAGIAQDFVWKVSGPHFRYRDNPDSTNHTHWYGGMVQVRAGGYRNDLNRPAAVPPAGTRYVFTLAPSGRRVDGAEARTLTYERVIGDRWSLDMRLHDVPIARYTLTGVEVAPDGTRHPLVFETAYAKMEPSAAVDFPASEILHGPHVHMFGVDRQ